MQVLNLFIEDKKITYFYGKKRELLIPEGVLKDCEIIDFNHIFYLLKKEIELNDIAKDTLFNLIFLQGFKFHCQKFENIKKDDLENLLEIEFENSSDKVYIDIEDQEDNYFSYSTIPEKNRLKYEEVFEKLNLKLNQILNLSSLFKFYEDGAYVIITQSLIVLAIKDKILKEFNFYSTDKLNSLYEDNNLIYENVKNILNSIEDPQDSFIENDFLLKFNFYLNEQTMKIVKKLQENKFEKIYLSGDLFFDFQRYKDLFREFQIEPFDVFKSQVPKNEKKVKLKNKNLQILTSIFLIFALVNLFFYNNSKRELQNLKLENAKLIEKISENKSKAKVQVVDVEEKDLTKRFNEVLNILLDEKSDDILITDYYMDNQKIEIRGLARDNEKALSLKEKLKNFNPSISLDKKDAVYFIISMEE